jgi:hypothetical protein
MKLIELKLVKDVICHAWALTQYWEDNLYHHDINPDWRGIADRTKPDQHFTDVPPCLPSFS